VSRIGLVLREGLVFGVIGGVFALLIRVVSVYATNDLMASMFSNYVTVALTFLIIGGAGRKMAAATKTTGAALQMGAIAGFISEVFHTVVAAEILSYLPVGQAAFNRLSPLAKRQAADSTAQMLNLSLDLVLAVIVGALIGWLGAWTLLRFRPPREPQG
jgi:hypothetical protein